jgi:threonine synthase
MAAARAPERLSTTATEVLAPYLSADLPMDEVSILLDEALDFPVPLTRLDDHTTVLELFHGPTLAFKDVGARVLARLFAATSTPGEDLTILTATSGDTGGAVADAFHGVAGTRVVVLYPKGQVSDRQELQFAGLGDNIHAFAVEGTFDDCQRMVKAALSRTKLHSEKSAERQLTSANSISLGRLLPQVTYYVHAFRQLPTEQRDRVVFIVPSGNFGDLTAGLLAKFSGLPVHRFVAAVNANDVVPEYLKSGVFTPRPSVRTLANAMDVGNPSNLERIRYLYREDIATLRRDVVASSHSDEEIRQAIRRVYERSGRIVDPHTAVGWLAWQAYRVQDPDAMGILLSTAHPAKFHHTIEPILGVKIPVPEALQRALQRPNLSQPLAPTVEALFTVLGG